MLYDQTEVRDPAGLLAKILNDQAGGPIFSRTDIRELMGKQWFKLSNLAHHLHYEITAAEQK